MDLLIILLMTAVSFIKLGQGFDIDLKHLVTHANRWLVFRGVLAAVFLVPVLFLILILIFQPTTAITLAIICLGVAPAADLSSNQVKTLGGDTRLAESILLISSLISIVTAPLLVKFFEIILGLHINVHFTHIIWQFAVAQFIPMILSVTLRYFFPKLIDIAKYVITGATLLLIICFIIIIIQKYTAFSEFKLNAYMALITVTVGAFILGILFAGKNPKSQIALAITSGLRNPGLAFLIASENFAKQRVELAMIPLLVTTVASVIVGTLVLKLLQKHWKLV